jgi:dipeptidyl aminopeptidase/acylaminoacyl peptidase
MNASEPFLTHLLRLPQVSDAFLSPDGRWAAFPWFRKHPSQDIFAVSTDGLQAPFALTRTGQNSEFVSWAPNSRSIIVSQDQAGDERFTLFRIWLDQPEQMIPLTQPRPSFFLRSGELSPDDRFLIYAANYDFDSQQEIIPTWIIRHDLATGRHITLARPKEPEYILPGLNHSGTHVLYNRLDRHPAGRQVYLVDVEGKNDEEILNFGDDVKTFARWLPDGENIIVVSDTPSPALQRYARLGVYHHPTRKLRWLVDDPQRTIESAWPTPDGLIVVNEMRTAGHCPSFLDPQTGKETHLPVWPGNLLPLGKSATPLADGRDAWVAISYAANRPAELVRFTIDTDGPQTFTSLTPAWEGISLSQAELFPADELAWTSSDGLTIHGWLYRARPNQQRAILYIHGGPTFHSENRFNAQIQYLVQSGFNVLDINYRGSTGYGAAFRERMKETGWGTLEMDDIVSAVRKLVKLNLSQPGITAPGTSSPTNPLISSPRLHPSVVWSTWQWTITPLAPICAY